MDTVTVVLVVGGVGSFLTREAAAAAPLTVPRLPAVITPNGGSDVASTPAS
jgi:hypothetical protein